MEELYRTYREWLVTIAFRITGDWDLAADVVQDVFVALLKSQKEQPPILSPKAWLLTSTVHRALDVKKKAWYRLRNFLTDWQSWKLVFQQDAEQRDYIQHIIDRLTPRERTVLVLRDLEGYPVKEIAQMLKISEATVRSLSRNGREKFIRLYHQENL